MEPLGQKDKIVEAQQRMVVIWGALLTSQFIFLTVLYIVKKELFHFDFSQPLAGSDPMLVAIAAVLSLSTFALSFVMKARILKQSEAEQNINMVQNSADNFLCALRIYFAARIYAGDADRIPVLFHLVCRGDFWHYFAFSAAKIY